MEEEENKEEVLDSKYDIEFTDDVYKPPSHIKTFWKTYTVEENDKN